MNVEILKEYLVKLGVQVDTSAFDKMKGLLNDLEKAMGKNALSIGMQMTKGAGLAAGALAVIDTAIIKNIQNIAKADMEYQLLAQKMFLNVDAAKAFKIATDTLGHSLPEIAWNAELKHKYFVLVKDIEDLKVPQEAKDMFKQVRDIGFEFDRMKMLAGRAVEFIAFNILKLNKGEARTLADYLKNLNENIKKNLPEWSRKVAEFLQPVIQLSTSLFKFISGGWTKFSEGMKLIFEWLDKIWTKMSSWQKQSVVLFGLLSPIFLKGSPILMGLALFADALLLIDDYMHFKDGKESMDALIIVWSVFEKIINGTKMAIVETMIAWDHWIHRGEKDYFPKQWLPNKQTGVMELRSPSWSEDIASYEAYEAERTKQELVDREKKLQANKAQNALLRGIPGIKDPAVIEAIKKASQATGVKPIVIGAIMNSESGGDQKAKSPKGAIGAMQLMPGTAEILKVNPYDLDENVKGGTQYFKDMFMRYKDQDKALAAYNMGPAALDKLLKAHPNDWKSYLSPETSKYVKDINAYLGTSSSDQSGVKVTIPTGVPSSDQSGVKNVKPVGVRTSFPVISPSSKKDPVEVWLRSNVPWLKEKGWDDNYTEESNKLAKEPNKLVKETNKLTKETNNWAVAQVKKTEQYAKQTYYNFSHLNKLSSWVGEESAASFKKKWGMDTKPEGNTTIIVNTPSTDPHEHGRIIKRYLKDENDKKAATN